MDNCVFCQIVQQKIKNYKIYEDDLVYGFLDHLPNANGHALVIPKQHYRDFGTCNPKVLQAVTLGAQKVAKIIADTFHPAGFNFISNQGAIAYQVVFHFHMHVIPKYQIDRGYILHRNIIRTELMANDDIYKAIQDQTSNNKAPHL